MILLAKRLSQLLVRFNTKKKTLSKSCVGLRQDVFQATENAAGRHRATGAAVSVAFKVASFMIEVVCVVFYIERCVSVQAIQLAMRRAYPRLVRPVATYESASTAAFKCGRTGNVLMC